MPITEEKIEKNCCSEQCCSGECGTTEPKLTTDEEENLEKMFFLVYHLHMQPTEVMALSDEQKEWLISRFIHQKQYEKEIVEEMRRGGGGLSPDFVKKIEASRNA